MDDVLGHISVDEGGALLDGEVLHICDGLESSWRVANRQYTVRIYSSTVTYIYIPNVHTPGQTIYIYIYCQK